MTLQSGDKFRVFVSYNFDDDDVGPLRSKGWITEFVESVEAVFCRREPLLKSDFVSFMAAKYHGGGDYRDIIREEMKRSHVLMAFVSQRFANSDECRDEMTLFQKVLNANKETSDKVFVPIVLHPDMPDHLPKMGLDQSCTRIDRIDAYKEVEGAGEERLFEPIYCSSRAAEDEQREFEKLASQAALRLSKRFLEIGGSNGGAPTKKKKSTPWRKRKIDRRIFVDACPQDLEVGEQIDDELRKQGFKNSNCASLAISDGRHNPRDESLTRSYQDADVIVVVHRIAEIQEARAKIGQAHRHIRKRQVQSDSRPCDLVVIGLGEDVDLSVHCGRLGAQHRQFGFGNWGDAAKWITSLEQEDKFGCSKQEEMA